jgi:RNA polymerase sigma-70 factor (ECF subfamily)
MGAKPFESLSQRLYFEHAAAVSAVLLRLGVPRSEVDDAVHDVFLILVRRPEAVAAVSNARAWLYGIALKVAATRRRWHKLKTFISLEGEAERDDNPTPHRHLEQRQASARVQAALTKLNGRKREVFVLFELEGLSGSEIAEVIGCPVNTVWTRLFHARKEFAHALSQQPRGSFEILNKGEQA